MLIKKNLLILLAFFPMYALAHVGHDHRLGFWSGFTHPFTGLDHLMMAIASAVLLCTATRHWKIAGLVGLVLAMIVGFAFGSLHFISASFAEYGIAVSLVVLAITLWTKANQWFVVTAMGLAIFHGAAHGIELGQSGHIIALTLGMVVALTIIYLFGLGIGAWLQKHIPYGKKIVGGLTAIVALIGLA